MIKYILLLISCSTIFGQQAFSIFDPAMQAETVVSAATPKIWITNSTTGSLAIGRYATAVWVATRFTNTAGSFTTASATLRLSKSGSPTGLLSAHIYSNDIGTNAPSVEIGSGSLTVSESSLGSTEGDVEFAGMSVGLTNGIYWLVVKKSGDPNSSNYSVWHYQSATYFASGLLYAWSGSAWSPLSYSTQGKFIISGQ